ncbi:MAG: Phosphoglycerate kinase, partial [Alphaproteobacteria bacterium MarineAlpha6_Bin6]
KNAKKNICKIIYPIDVTISNKNNINILDLKNNHQIFDLGKNTMQLIFNIVDISKTIIWSGPLGFFEKKPFDKGTNKLASYINSKKKIISVAGGGDTISALKKNKKFNNFSYLSTGGGAFLSWLEDYSLVGIDVLKN